MEPGIQIRFPAHSLWRRRQERDSRGIRNRFRHDLIVPGHRCGGTRSWPGAELHDVLQHDNFNVQFNYDWLRVAVHYQQHSRGWFPDAIARADGEAFVTVHSAAAIADELAADHGVRSAHESADGA